MRYCGRLPLTGDAFVVEVHLGWSVAIYLLAQLPLVGAVVRDILWAIFG